MAASSVKRSRTSGTGASLECRSCSGGGDAGAAEGHATSLFEPELARCRKRDRAALAGSCERSAHEIAEQRRRARRPRLELRVELRGDEPRVVRELDDLDEAPLLEGAGHREARVDECGPVRVVHLVAVAMALEDDAVAVRLGGS